MDALAPSTSQLLHELRQVCYEASIVDYIEELLVDIDILKVRIHLIKGERFISVFYNVATEKTAFALIEAGRRIYGVDNAKMGWHKHPWGTEEQHITCQAVTFAEFLADVEDYVQRDEQVVNPDED